MKTTLNKIRAHSPCGIRQNFDGSLSGLLKLMKFLGKEKTDDEEVSILQILESNGLDDSLWCLRAVIGRDKEIRLFAVWCARQVQHLMTDKLSINAIDVAERFANGDATSEELASARDAAGAAARAAAGASAGAAARAAARDAAGASAGASAGAAARDAARAAARDAAWAAARDSAWDSARAAARAAQEKELIRICTITEEK